MRPAPSIAALVFMAAAAIVPAAIASAQSVQAPAKTKPAASGKKSHSVPGSPLDTLMSTHLWVDTPVPQDFVKATRPDQKSVDYTPLVGKDPDRPKPRDKANIEALQAELEHDGAVNAKKGSVLRPKARRKAE